MFRKAALSQQLSSLRSEAEGLEEQIKQELLRSRRQQVEERMKAISPTAPLAADLAGWKQALDRFEDENQDVDYVTWQAKLSELGRDTLPEIDPGALRAVATLEQRVVYKQQRAEQLELELLPMDNEMSILEKRRESLERRLSDRLTSEDQDSSSLEEAESRLEESQNARRSLQLQLDNIRRLAETDFSEMTVLTPASWQTTDFNEGRHKVFVFTFAGCLLLLTLPIFGLEHFFPSGDPAERAAKSLGLPLVSQGTFVTQRLKHDKVQIHPVNSESLRLLALRIQQSVPGPGATVVFSGLNHHRSSIPTISYLAECLARREERVLIVDACEPPVGFSPSHPQPRRRRIGYFDGDAGRRAVRLGGLGGADLRRHRPGDPLGAQAATRPGRTDRLSPQPRGHGRRYDLSHVHPGGRHDSQRQHKFSP